ncbi:hypothetical protein L596_017603 [Steinernema carpocapsae]|uniref:Uncharacterized protein n=1 Tax=Steinernema carpocapsae TaxID=34508 RepID=A0A4U5N2V9_STECR|nr:hypothetical protein L596_017603 [Steinernema carpocapsae]
MRHFGAPFRPCSKSETHLKTFQVSLLIRCTLPHVYIERQQVLYVRLTQKKLSVYASLESTVTLQKPHLFASFSLIPLSSLFFLIV